MNLIVMIILLLLVVVQSAVQMPSTISQNLPKYSDPFMKLIFIPMAYGTKVLNNSFNAITNPLLSNQSFDKTLTCNQHNIVQQSTILSTQDPFLRRQAEQIAVILPPIENNIVYTGILTFIASKPVEIEVFHSHGINNLTKMDPMYGRLMTVPFDLNSNMVVSLINANQFRLIISFCIICTFKW